MSDTRVHASAYATRSAEWLRTIQDAVLQVMRVFKLGFGSLDVPVPSEWDGVHELWGGRATLPVRDVALLGLSFDLFGISHTPDGRVVFDEHWSYAKSLEGQALVEGRVSDTCRSSFADGLLKLSHVVNAQTGGANRTFESVFVEAYDACHKDMEDDHVNFVFDGRTLSEASGGAPLVVYRDAGAHADVQGRYELMDRFFVFLGSQSSWSDFAHGAFERAVIRVLKSRDAAATPSVAPSLSQEPVGRDAAEGGASDALIDDDATAKALSKSSDTADANIADVNTADVNTADAGAAVDADDSLAADVTSFMEDGFPLDMNLDDVPDSVFVGLDKTLEDDGSFLFDDLDEPVDVSVENLPDLEEEGDDEDIRKALIEAAEREGIDPLLAPSDELVFTYDDGAGRIDMSEAPLFVDPRQDGTVPSGVDTDVLMRAGILRSGSDFASSS
jgi:hypothetical protein